MWVKYLVLYIGVGHVTKTAMAEGFGVGVGSFFLNMWPKQLWVRITKTEKH